MKYEVRCCCRPEKLLGYLHAPENVREWTWTVERPVQWSRLLHADQTLPITRIKLPIALISDGQRVRYYAVKAEGVEIDTLRKIVGFEEA